MSRFLYFLGAATLAANPYDAPYSCHKPTDQEFYARQKACYAALKANLKMVPYTRLKQAGIEVGDLAYASTETMNRAYDTGEATGLSPYGVYDALDKATDEYIESHTRVPSGTGARIFIAGGAEVHECLADVFGRPND